MSDDHLTRMVNRVARFDYSEARTHSHVWEAPQPGHGPNFWIPLCINPEQEHLWADLLDSVEDLDVKPMLETSQNAKNKQDAAWSQFIDLLEYKADLHGTHVKKVKPEGTIKECAVCGVETAKPIWVREHSCPACGHTEDRDFNAAKNILYRGLKQLGAGRSESTPVQTGLPALTPQREAVGVKRVIEAGSPGIVRKSSISVMNVGHRPTNLRAGDAREQLTRDAVSRTT